MRPPKPPSVTRRVVGPARGWFPAPRKCTRRRVQRLPPARPPSRPRPLERGFFIGKAAINEVNVLVREIYDRLPNFRLGAGRTHLVVKGFKRVNGGSWGHAAVVFDRVAARARWRRPRTLVPCPCVSSPLSPSAISACVTMPQSITCWMSGMIGGNRNRSPQRQCHGRRRGLNSWTPKSSLCHHPRRLRAGRNGRNMTVSSRWGVKAISWSGARTRSWRPAV